jgi:hypothetical protein
MSSLIDLVSHAITASCFMFLVISLITPNSSDPQVKIILASLTKVQFVIIPLKHHLHIKRNQLGNLRCYRISFFQLLFSFFY